MGLDILFDSNLKPWLLELNEYPHLDAPHKEGYTVDYNSVRVSCNWFQETKILKL